MNRTDRSVWVRFLAGACVCTLSLIAFAGDPPAVDNPEAEPNENKAAATVADSGGPMIGMAAGDFLSGTSIGSSTLAGPASIDNFRVRTAAAPSGIYRHRLVIMSTTPGHTGSIRGLAQTGGTIQTATDIPFQTSNSTTTPPRFNQWYGFGRQEQVYYRISGTPTTISPYAVTLSTETVTPIIVPSLLAAGSITFTRDTAGGNVNDIDMWLYDADFNAIPSAGNDGQDALTRALAAGTYYLAVSNFNTANNLASPPDDTFRSGSVLDFPDAVANTSQIANLNMGIAIIHSGGTVTAAGTKAGPFDVVWYQVVVGGTNPSGMGAADPDTVGQGGSTTLSVTVIPGETPPSTGITVTVDASGIGGSAMLALFDDGQGGDEVADDGVYARTIMIPAEAPVGPASLSFTVADDQGRSGAGAILLAVTIPPPPNDECASATTISSTQFGSPIQGTTNNSAVTGFDASGACGGGLDNRDVYYTLTTTVSGFWTVDTCSTPLLDTVVSIHTGCPDVEVLRLVDGQSCQDSTCGPGNAGARTMAFLDAETTYVIRVATKDTVTGDFTLVVTPPGQTPGNDECEGAVATSALEIPFNNDGATTGDLAFACDDPILADVWFAWTTPEVIGSGSWTVRATGANSRLALWRRDACPDGKGGPDICLSDGAIGSFEATTGDLFFVQVGGNAVAPLTGDAVVLFEFVPNTGLCCMAGTLSITSQADCEGMGGTYSGDNTSGGITGPGAVFAGQSGVSIPDNSPAGVTDTVIVVAPGEIRTLVVRVEVEHPFIGDLTATISNGSITVPLFARVGRVIIGNGSGADLVPGNVLRFYDAAGGDLWAAAGVSEAIEAGDYRPSGASNVTARLNDFVGASITGEWTLTLTDAAEGDSGTLVSWSLEFNPLTDCSAPPCLADFNQDGAIDADDLGDFINCYFGERDAPGSCPLADFNQDGAIDGDDLGDFINIFFGGC